MSVNERVCVDLSQKGKLRECDVFIGETAEFLPAKLAM